MKKILFPRNKNFYKASLHTHSTISLDGHLTPEELKKEYMAKGYSVVAYTDHETFVKQNHLTDQNFVALNGVELSAVKEKEEGAYTFERTCHICFIALSPETTRQPAFNINSYTKRLPQEFIDKLNIDPDCPDYKGTYTPESINGMIKKGIEGGFFVTYNHPSWSGETFKEYLNYQGMHSMEIFNHVCYLSGTSESDAFAYDDMLRDGKRLYCIATDDTHRPADIGGGFTVINADKLEYTALTTSLVNGDFYASTGPEIKEISYEDGFVKVECSPAKLVQIKTIRRRASGTSLAREGNLITHAEMQLYPEEIGFRVTVIDENGLVAWSNAYFLDQIEK